MAPTDSDHIFLRGKDMGKKNTTGVCRDCKVQLVPVVNWSYFKGKKRFWCRTCVAAYGKRWYHKNPVRASENNRRGRCKIHVRFSTAKSIAKKRSVPWELTKEQYGELIAKPCTYCGYELNKTGCGLDQKVAGEGYTVENSTSCCRVCNVAKSSWFSYDEMLVIGEAIRRVKDRRLES